MKKYFMLSAALLVLLASAKVMASDNAARAKVIEDIKAAFAGETTASAKYAAYAKKAEADGYPKIALLFKAASKAESVHAGNHKAALEQLGEKAGEVTPKFEVKTTKENLEDAIKGETYEVTTMYPEFIKDANEANVSIALISFNYAYQTEQKHKAMYTNALKMLNEKNEKAMPSHYQVCLTCGNTYEGTAPARCGICMTPSERFVTF
jgi:rubrerythrin